MVHAIRNQIRRLPVGAELSEDGAHFRVWAPRAQKVRLVFESFKVDGQDRLELLAEGGGYFSAFVKEVEPETKYRFQLDDDEYLYPDLASRFQPDGPHGWSQIVDPCRYQWRDHKWGGVKLSGNIAYELHIGTFTAEGTYESARMQLRELKRIGITLIELMPVAEFQGNFGWGYDGVNMFAPTRLYGTPDELRAFVDEAHQNEIGVVLDVVYNHFGADGNYSGRYSEDFVSHDYANEWGDALNFDGKNSLPVREYFIANAGYWIDEFHFDGLRLDATQQINDESDCHVLQEVCQRVRDSAKGRQTIVIAENEPQDVRLIEDTADGGYGIDCLWNDDFHHACRVAMTGKSEGYYADYKGTPQELISVVKRGFLYQGQHSICRNKGHGTPSLHLNADKLINFIQNHDQVANTGRGWRMDRLTSMGKFKAMTALLLLSPGMPMLFQGQEFCSSAPFTYFADHEPELAAAVARGRFDSLRKFRSLDNDAMLSATPVPHDRTNFEKCKLNFDERISNKGFYEMTQTLIELRQSDPVFSRANRGTVDGAILGSESFLLRYFGGEFGDRLVLINMGADLVLDPCPEPLFAPPSGRQWRQIFSTEWPEFDGCGAPEAGETGRSYLPAHCCAVLTSS